MHLRRSQGPSIACFISLHSSSASLTQYIGHSPNFNVERLLPRGDIYLDTAFPPWYIDCRFTGFDHLGVCLEVLSTLGSILGFAYALQASRFTSLVLLFIQSIQRPTSFHTNIHFLTTPITTTLPYLLPRTSINLQHSRLHIQTHHQTGIQSKKLICRAIYQRQPPAPFAGFRHHLTSLDLVTCPTCNASCLPTELRTSPTSRQSQSPRCLLRELPRRPPPHTTFRPRPRISMIPFAAVSCSTDERGFSI